MANKQGRRSPSEPVCVAQVCWFGYSGVGSCQQLAGVCRVGWIGYRGVGSYSWIGYSGVGSYSGFPRRQEAAHYEDGRSTPIR